MKTPSVRIGIFGRATSAHDGGADTLLHTLRRGLAGRGADSGIELVEIPWRAWSHRRRPFRYAWCRFVRRFGAELPLVNVNSVCRRYALDAAWFAAPAYAAIDIPFAYSLWDLGHRTIPEFPEMRSGRDPWTMREAQYQRMLGQASRVLVGNHAGAAEARRCYGVAEDRLVVLPFPNPDFGIVRASLPSWLGEQPYFLYPAQSWAHKNHATLLRAFAEFQRARPAGANLIFVGGDKGNTVHLRDLARDLGIADAVRFGGFVSRQELKGLYERATALLFPSLLGPNNLPPQEAAMLGCAAVLSDLPGHREQLGDGAVYCGPLDVDAWKSAMLRLVDDQVFRTALVGRARAAVAGYTWEAYARGLERVFLDLAAIRRLWR